MRKYIFEPLRNWRTLVLAALAGIAFFALMGETETAAAFFAAKIAGAISAYACYTLARYWWQRGMLNELAEIIEE